MPEKTPVFRLLSNRHAGVRNPFSPGTFAMDIFPVNKARCMYARYGLIVLLATWCIGIAMAATPYDTGEGFRIDIPSGWEVERDSNNNGIVTFVQENGDPLSTWIKMTCAASSSSGIGGSDQDIIAALTSNAQSLDPTIIDAPHFDAQEGIYVFRFKTAKDFYITMAFYRSNGVDTTGLVSSRYQQTAEAEEKNLFDMVRSTSLTESARSPGFCGTLAIVGLAVIGLLFMRRFRS